MAEQDNFFEALRGLKVKVDSVPEKVNYGKLSFEEFIERQKLLSVKNMFDNLTRILAGDDIWADDPGFLIRETWEEMMKLRLDMEVTTQRFEEAQILTPQCLDCEEVVHFWSLGGNRSKTELIYKCINDHELRILYGDVLQGRMNFFREGGEENA